MAPITPTDDSRVPFQPVQRLSPGGTDSVLPVTGPYRPEDADCDFEERKTAPRATSRSSDTGLPVGGSPVARAFGKYELLEEIGHGGMGVVWKAHDIVLNRIVALKTLQTRSVLQTDEHRLRFFREAQLAAQLQHPHIVTIHDFGEQDGQPFFAMALVEGDTLARQVKTFTAQPRAAAALIEKVARAVHHAHEKGILHRDLKPSNILLDRQGEPLICDFGLARLREGDEELTRTGVVLGTPAYMAPEQAGGNKHQVGPAADIWSLGVILFELLAGRRPFQANSTEHLSQTIIHDDPPRLRALRPELDRNLETIVRKCLAKDPGQRYPSSAELADDLGRWLRGEPIRARPEPLLARCRRFVRRHPTLTSTACLLSIFAVVLALVLGSSPATRPEGGDLKTLLQRLQEKRPVELVGEKGLPRENYVIRAGRTKFTGPDLDDQPLLLKTPASTPILMELLPDPQEPRYRLSAEIRRDEVERPASAGIYFALSERLTTDGTELWFCTLAENTAGGSLELKLHRFNENRLAGGSINHIVTLLGIPHGQPLSPDGWRKIAAEVGPRKITIFCGQKRVGEITPAELNRHARSHAELVPVLAAPVPQFDSRGSLGLFALNVWASFRNVIVQPLE